MRHYLRSLIVRLIGPVLAGSALGAMGTVVFSFLCPGTYWLLAGHAAPGPLPLLNFALAGAVAGSLVGLCVAVDRAQDDPSGEQRKIAAAAPKPRRVSLRERRLGWATATDRANPARQSRAGVRSARETSMCGR
jgi:hypothetical protein